MACEIIDVDSNEWPQERALGVKWCVEQYLVSLEPVKSEFPNTKRAILSGTSSVFDPMDLAAPYVINAKLIIQELRETILNGTTNFLMISSRSGKVGRKV